MKDNSSNIPKTQLSFEEERKQTLEQYYELQSLAQSNKSTEKVKLL